MCKAGLHHDFQLDRGARAPPRGQADFAALLPEESATSRWKRNLWIAKEVGMMPTSLVLTVLVKDQFAQSDGSLLTGTILLGPFATASGGRGFVFGVFSVFFMTSSSSDWILKILMQWS